MANVSSVKISVPTGISGEIVRQELISKVLDNPKKLTYIHAGAGYGKTTLLAQVSNSVKNAVWLTLDDENDIFSFLGLLSDAVHQAFPTYELNFSQYLPFEGKKNFNTILANAFISSIEQITPSCMLVLDDLHTIKDKSIRDFITATIKYKPEKITICVGSREAPWQEFVALQARGNILEVTQNELVFTQEEAFQVMGLQDENIYALTEGWPLGIVTFRVLLENGVDLIDVSAQGSAILDTYLFYECISRFPPEIVGFLQTSACFEELHPDMIDAVTGRRNSGVLLDSLVRRNIFTTRTRGGMFRYHTLFRKHLQKDIGILQRKQLQDEACRYYYQQKQYARAAQYAMLAGNMKMLEQIILDTYEEQIKKGNFGEIRVWLKALDDAPSALGAQISLVRGIFLSSIGHFGEAKAWLDNVGTGADDSGGLHFDAMVHKARILRNSVSFAESNLLLEQLLADTRVLSPEQLYEAWIEKIYNLCWDSRINEAYQTTCQMIEVCARAGHTQVRGWFERYLTAVHFFAGRMRDTIDSYEKSLELSEEERNYLDMHSVGMYAAKAYQMMGDQGRAEALITSEIRRLRNTGQYEELWVAYLLGAEIYYHIADMKHRTGGADAYSIAMRYLSLGIEYAPLYRTSEFQLTWAKTQRLVYSLILCGDSEGQVIKEIISDLDNVGDYLKTIVLGRLFGYYIMTNNIPQAIKYAQWSIEVGERANTMMIPTIAYGFLSWVAVAAGDDDRAIALTTRYLRLCRENGIYDYFKISGLYGRVLQYALDKGIEVDFVAEMMAFAGYKTKKVYIATFGGLNIYPFKERSNSLKMRSKKERELLAFLLDSGSIGATKEQIYHAIWSESESDNVRRLIGVNLAHIKKDLASLGIGDLIINQRQHYCICRDEIECDYELFEAAAEEFLHNCSNEAAQIILSLYKGEYLSDFEAFWAVGKRIRYQEIYEQALQFVKSNP